MIPSGKSISRWGFLRPFGPCMEDRHEHYQYRDSCPCRRWKDDLDGESAICQWSHFRTRERRKRDNEDGHLVFGAAAWDYLSLIHIYLDASSLYQVPLMLEREAFADKVCEALRLPIRPSDLRDWEDMVDRFQHPEREVTIALVGKYIQLHDAYLSVAEALRHGGIAHRARVRIQWVQADELTGPDVDLNAVFAGVHGILVPGGFGNRGIEGKMVAARYAREHNIPYLGICLGMQVAVMEFARHVCGMEGASSTEFTPDTPYPVIDIMEEQKGLEQTGGTMRLGAYRCRLAPESRLRALYGADEVFERHRHRYEFNNAYIETFAAHGLRVAGVNPERELVEAVELNGHPWFVGVQFHPEFKSRPNRPHPLFIGLIGASIRRAEEETCWKR